MLLPLNKYIVVAPVNEEKTSSGVLLPEDFTVDNHPYKVVDVIQPNVDSNLHIGAQIIVPSHMIEEVCVFGKTYYLVTENNVMGIYSKDV